MGIYATIRREWDDYINDDVEIVDGCSFNQYSTIKRIHLYHNAKFENPTYFDGREKLFFDVSRYRCEVASKTLNFDTKDIRLWPMNPTSEIGTFLLEKELALWLKKSEFGKLLNRIAEEAPVYGTAIIRKTKKGASLVDLRRVAMDPTVETIGESRFVTIKHYLTEAELRKKKADGWDADAIDGLLESKATAQEKPAYEDGTGARKKGKSPYFAVYERFGEVKKSELTGKEKDKDAVRSLFIVAEPYGGSKSDGDGIILFKSEWSGDYPFRDFHYSKIKGRYLGLGVVEELFQIQERQNELANQKRISMEISSMHVFQTPGKSTALRNLLTDLRNGDVLATGVNGAITPITTEERNLPAFGEEEKKYDALADRLTFSYDAVRGESLPASTPVTNAVMQNANANSVFAFKRENLGLTLQSFFNGVVAPQLVRDMSASHILRFMGGVDDLGKLDGLVAKTAARNAAAESLLAGRPMSSEEQSALESEISDSLKKRGQARFLELAEGFYKDLEFEFDFMVINEQENVAGMAQNLFQLVTALAQNPQALENPITKALMYEYARKIGISPLKLEMAEDKGREAAANAPMAQPAPQPQTAMPQIPMNA